MSKGESTETAYTVEAMFNYHAPIQIANQIFDNRWRTVNFEKSEIGVPQAAEHHRETIKHGMLGYSAAQALRWWLHAIADARFGGLCLETRIMEHKIQSSYSIGEGIPCEHVGGESNNNCWPKRERP